MATRTGDLGYLQKAEWVCDQIGDATRSWNRFNLEVVGSQMIRTADSVGANMAESHGRHRYGEKIQFLLYARGSLTETQYWLRRCQQRNLMPPTACQQMDQTLEELAKEINGYINYLRNNRTNNN